MLLTLKTPDEFILQDPDNFADYCLKFQQTKQLEENAPIESGDAANEDPPKTDQAPSSEQKDITQQISELSGQEVCFVCMLQASDPI